MLVHGHGAQSIIAIMLEMDLTTSLKSLAINIDDVQRCCSFWMFLEQFNSIP